MEQVFETTQLKEQINSMNQEIDKVNARINSLATEKNKALEQQKMVKTLVSQAEMCRNRLSDLNKTEDSLSQDIDNIKASLRDEISQLTVKLGVSAPSKEVYKTK